MTMSPPDEEKVTPSPTPNQEQTALVDMNNLDKECQQKDVNQTPYITDGGVKAWSTVLGGYVHSTESQFAGRHV
jgi:hypothetical protein